MNALVASPNQAVEISVSDISPSPYQPRVHFDEEKLDELAESIKEKGILQPVTVRPVEGDKPYELVMGERRLRASIKAEKETILCFVKNYSDQEAREIALIENLQREDLTPMEEARSVQMLVETCDGNKAQAARSLGKADGYVQGMLDLLMLPREVQNMLEAKLINVAAAKVIFEVEGAEQQIKGAELAQRLNLSAVQLRARMQKHIDKKKVKKGGVKESSGDRKPATFKTLSTSLVGVYEALEGFDFNDLGGDEKSIKNREMLRKQTALVRQSLARAEVVLLQDPPQKQVSKKGESKDKAPVLSSANV